MSRSQPTHSRRTPPVSGAGVGSILVTVALMIASVVLAVLLFTRSLVWALDSRPNPFGFALGVYVPVLVSLAGVVVGIVLLVKRRPAYLAPVVAIVVSLLCWWVGGMIVAAG